MFDKRHPQYRKRLSVRCQKWTETTRCRAEIKCSNYQKIGTQKRAASKQASKQNQRCIQNTNSSSSGDGSSGDSSNSNNNNKYNSNNNMYIYTYLVSHRSTLSSSEIGLLSHYVGLNICVSTICMANYVRGKKYVLTAKHFTFNARTLDAKPIELCDVRRATCDVHRFEIHTTKWHRKSVRIYG